MAGAEAGADGAVASVTSLAQRWAKYYCRTFGWTIAPVWGLEGGRPGICACRAGEDCARPGKHLVEGVRAVRREEEASAVWGAEGSEGWGIAVMTGGMSRLLVLDVEEGVRMPGAWLQGGGTLAQHTPSGGQHWFFLLQGGEVVAPADLGPGLFGGTGAGGKVVSDGGYVIIFPREGYDWIGGSSALVEVGKKGLMEVPRGLRMTLERMGVLGGGASAAVIWQDHQDDPWRCERGAGLVAGTPTRSLTRMGDRARLVDGWGHLIRHTPALGLYAWTSEQGWVGGPDAEIEVGRIVQYELPGAIKNEARAARAAGRDDDWRAGMRWAAKTSTRLSTYVMTGLGEDPRISVPGSDWDRKSWLLGLPMADGVGRAIDLRTGEVLPGAREMLITVKAGAFPAPAGAWRGGVWGRVLDGLEDRMGADWARLLRLAAGATLFGRGGLAAAWEWWERNGGGGSSGRGSGGRGVDSIFVLVGQTRSGKTTVLEALAACMGGYARAMPEELVFMRAGGGGGNPDFHNWEIRGARLLYMSEPPEGKILNVPKLKGISGGDGMTGRAPYGRTAVHFTPDAIVWMATNHGLEHTDAALWERLRLFEFETDWSGDKGDASVREALVRAPEERGRVLAWAVQGALELVREGWGDTGVWTGSVGAAKRAMDPIHRFIEERVEITRSSGDVMGLGALAAECAVWVAVELDPVEVRDLGLGKKHRIREELAQRLRQMGVAVSSSGDRLAGCRMR